ncbi:MAG: dienelactone hydrolase family protein [Bacteroidales bacterium]|nr:dienelactone hydrolase family protein [Bacteroidales bacterium]
MNYLLYLPKKYDKSSYKKLPLILFLHGAHERGNDIEIVKKHGPPKVAEEMKLPFIIVSPQCPLHEHWEPNVLDNLLNEIIKKYAVDTKRIYLTGLSMGGFATWQMAIRDPEKFTAIAPICGGGNPNEAYKLKNLPIWNFHGALDTIIPIKNSEEMVEAVKKVGGNIKFTVYSGVGHDSWTETYNNPELYKWFLKHEK